jgi:hypothetical protein
MKNIKTKAICSEVNDNALLSYQKHCKGKLVYRGAWEYNLKIQPNSHLFDCPVCSVRLVCDNEETRKYVRKKDIEVPHITTEICLDCSGKGVVIVWKL